MATIQRVKNKKGYSYRAIVRNIGLKEVSKTFPNRQLANQFIYKMESDRQARALYGGRITKTKSKRMSNPLPIRH